MQVADVAGQPLETKAAEVRQQKLVHAAHEFEAQMMQELLKPLMHGMSEDSEDGSDGQGNALGMYGMETLAQGISERGGLGIANRLIERLARPDRAQGVPE